MFLCEGAFPASIGGLIATKCCVKGLTWCWHLRMTLRGWNYALDSEKEKINHSHSTATTAAAASVTTLMALRYALSILLSILHAFGFLILAVNLGVCDFVMIPILW